MPLESVKNKNTPEDMQRHVARIRRVTWTIDHGTRPDANHESNTSIQLEVDSPWGKGSAFFPNCGDCDWRDWLSSMDADYIGQKLFGLATREPDHRKTMANIRGYINELRSEDAITVPEANRLRRRLREEHVFDPREGLDGQVGLLVGFVRSHDQLREFGNPVQNRDSARFTGFKRHAWVPFQEMMLAEFERAQAHEAVPDEQVDALPAEDDDLEMVP
jgi:hypothetical protein